MELLVTADSTNLNYWLNWRFSICATWVLLSMTMAVLMIWKYEGTTHSKPDTEAPQQCLSSCSGNDEVWMPCLKQIHPMWLLMYRVVALCLLLATLIVKTHSKGLHMYYYYTQWTFTLLTIYFGLGSLLSMYGCYWYYKANNVHNVPLVAMKVEAAEQVPAMPLLHGKIATRMIPEKNLNCQEQDYIIGTNVWVLVLEVIYQMSAGAVMLTDAVYWSIIFPFLTIKDYDLNFMTVNMHTLNVIVLLGDAALNRLRFPWFRICYLVLWTGSFVLFQWIVHACIWVRWPYAFLDLASPYAPLWYLFVGLLQLPCYGMFKLVVDMKSCLLSKWFAQSYQASR